MTADPTIERVELDGDGVRGSWVTSVALATAVVTACGVAVAWELARSAGTTPRSARFDESPEDIQTIELSLLTRSGQKGVGQPVEAPAQRPPAMFSEQQRVDAAARTQLSTYGWSDRARGTVHIPLERAFELYLQREGARSTTPANGSARPPEDPR
jgi:hypothetical protein